MCIDEQTVKMFCSLVSEHGADLTPDRQEVCGGGCRQQQAVHEALQL